MVNSFIYLNSSLRNCYPIFQFISDQYARVKIRELEQKNDFLLLQFGINQKLSLDSKNNSYQLQFDKKTENNTSKCGVIHIGIVCAGYKSSRSVATLLKSILFYRKQPLHFHILVDEVANDILTTLFDTWAVPQVNVSFYSTSLAIPLVNWIPNNHYSGVYGLLKLTLPKILPKDVSRIIVIDTDLTFVANIAELWQFFDKFRNKQAIGLVENQSDWYLGKLWKFYQPWPAIGRGFNTGVILLDLLQLHSIKWSELWRNITQQALQLYSATRLADQDVFNAVIKKNPGLVYQLPCEWNIQLGDNTLSEFCYEDYDVKVIHWNSPRKLDVKNKHIDYFKSLYYTFVEYNGNLLRRNLYNCNENQIKAKPTTSTLCYKFQSSSTTKHRTHLFIRDYDILDNYNLEITLLVQLSMDRLRLIENLANHWSGPISVTVYATDFDLLDLIAFFDLPSLANRKNIALHIVYKQEGFYPVNLLRNVGLKNVKTKYVFLSDVDFLPNLNLYEYLKEMIQMFNDDLTKKAFIIPAFESQRYRNNFPKTKKELLQMWDDKLIYTFRYHVWVKGHSPTNYTKWRSANKPYKVSWAPDFEPYILVDKNVPLYDTRFVGFGWNKVSHIMELATAGFEFWVLPEAFMVHLPHAPSQDIAQFRTSPVYRRCLTMLKEDFIKDLEKKYGKTLDNNNINIVTD